MTVSITQGIKWGIVLSGPSASMEELKKYTQDWTLLQIDSSWEARLPLEHQECDEKARTIHSRNTILYMRGVLKLVPMPTGIKIVTLAFYDENGNRTTGMPLDLAIENSDLDGLHYSQPDEIKPLIPENKIASKNQLLSYWGHSDKPGFSTLFTVYEWIESENRALIPEVIEKSKVTQFKQTCNHVSSGPTARHGPQGHDAPRQPMPIEEATHLIRNLSNRYLEWLSVKLS